MKCFTINNDRAGNKALLGFVPILEVSGISAFLSSFFFFNGLCLSSDKVVLLDAGVVL